MVIFGPRTQAVENKPLINFSEKLIEKKIQADLSIAEDGDSDNDSQQFRNTDQGLAGAPASVMQTVSKQGSAHQLHNYKKPVVELS